MEKLSEKEKLALNYRVNGFKQSEAVKKAGLDDLDNKVKISRFFNRSDCKEYINSLHENKNKSIPSLENQGQFTHEDFIEELKGVLERSKNSNQNAICLRTLEVIGKSMGFFKSGKPENIVLMQDKKESKPDDEILMIDNK